MWAQPRGSTKCYNRYGSIPDVSWHLHPPHSTPLRPQPPPAAPSDPQRPPPMASSQVSAAPQPSTVAAMSCPKLPPDARDRPRVTYVGGSRSDRRPHLGDECGEHEKARGHGRGRWPGHDGVATAPTGSSSSLRWDQASGTYTRVRSSARRLVGGAGSGAWGALVGRRTGNGDRSHGVSGSRSPR